MMKKAIGAFLCVALLTAAGLAQQAAGTQAVPAADQATTEDVLQMFKEMHFEQQMANVQSAMTQQMKGVFQKMLQGEEFEKLPADKKAKLIEIMNDSIKDAVEIYPIKEMVNDFAPMYAKYLTKSDIQAITAFYRTPTGQKLLEKSPDITRDAMAIVGPKMQERMSGYMEKMQKKMVALVQEPDSEPITPAATPKN